MKRHLGFTLSAIALMAALSPANANFVITVGGGPTALYSFDLGNGGTSACAVANVECMAHVVVGADGANVIGNVNDSASAATGQSLIAAVRQLVVVAGNASAISQATQGTTNGVAVSGATYNTIAASQTTQALTGGGGGATGDYLSHCVVIPTSTSPGVVTIIDNASTIYAFPGGASSISNLVPFAIPVGSKSVSGAWKVTTGANLSAVCTGKFT